MTSDPYTTIRAFVQDLGELVGGQGDLPSVVRAVKERLADLIQESPTLPQASRALDADHYARHLLYRDPGDRFEIVVMAWSPGQATPVHDHSGIWCVEGVLEGVIDVTRYDLRESMSAERVRMHEVEVIHAGLGACGALIPPLEYHRIANPYPAPAYTLHVYGGCMRSCRVFTEHADGSYQVAVRQLGFSSPAATLPPA